MLESIGLLYAYNAWANERILNVAARLTPDKDSSSVLSYSVPS